MLVAIGCVLLECLDVCQGGSEFVGEVVVIGYQGGKGLSVGFSGAGKTGERVVGCIFFVAHVCCNVGVVSSVLACLLLEAKGALGMKEISLEFRPCFVCGVFLVPFFTLVKV